MISIIIPTYNEAKSIVQLLSYLNILNKQNKFEIIVSDAGSEDETLQLAKNFGARALLSPDKGRAAQMNFGAGCAVGDIFYFIHADTFPPITFVDDIERAVSEEFGAGRYRTKFDSNNFLLKINAFFTRFDWFICSGGDQTFFITKKLFKKINGFDENMRIMEDYDIVKRVKHFARYKIFRKAALISARKYETNSWWKVQMANKTIVRMYKEGASQQEMIDKYKQLLVYR